MEHIYAALIKAQSEFKPIIKNATANTGTFSYSYMTLDALLDAVKPGLSKNDLGIIQNIVTDENKKMFVNTKVIHKSGEFIDNTCPVIGNVIDMQKLGSAITYARRYGLQSMLGIFAESDDDGAATKHMPSNQNQRPQANVQRSGVSAAQVSRLHALRKNANIDIIDFQAFLETKNIKDVAHLSRNQYDAICNNFLEKVKNEEAAQNNSVFTTDDVEF